MKNWSIRWRINLSFAVILALIVIMGALSMVELVRIEQANDSLKDDSLVGMEYSNELRSAWIMNYALTEQQVIFNEELERRRVAIGLAANQALIDELTGKYERTISKPEDRVLFGNFAEQRDIYLQVQRRITEHEHEAGNGTDRREDTHVGKSNVLIKTELTPQFTVLDGALQELVDFNRRGASAAEVQITSGVDNAEIAILVSFLAALAIAIVSGYLLKRAITQPLDRLLETTHVVSKGDFTRRVRLERRDEFGALGDGFDRMLDSLVGLVEQVRESVLQVNTSVTEIGATSNEQQATATEIAATTTEIGATSREISATSKELVNTMHEVSGVAEQTAGLAGSSQAGLSRMEDTMQHVAEAAGSINAKLAVLNEKAGNINQVVTTITKVADQTNLLSLNAAIEAEKAGEAGRGFAVVATEIRRLADQTAVATEDIGQMVKEIQSAVAAGVMGMDKFSEEVRRGIQEVQQVGEQLSQIIQQVQTLAPRVAAATEGMQAQATGAEQISDALAQLTDASQQTVQSLQQSNEAITGLSKVADDMRSAVSRFRLLKPDGAQAPAHSEPDRVLAAVA